MRKDKRMGRKRAVATLVIGELACGLAAVAMPRDGGFAKAAGVVLIGATAAGSEGDCKYVYDAGEKVFDVDHHVYTTQTGKYINGGKPKTGEMILSGRNRYLLYNGKWQKSPLDIEEGKKLAQENRKNNKSTCHYLRDELVGGDAAQVYSMRTDLDGSINDHTIWISKSRGLYLRQESDISVNGTESDKFHISTRYEYTNVYAPAI
jgi:hypothetical protein